MRNTTCSCMVAAVGFLALACADARPPTEPVGSDAPRVAEAATGQSVTWATPALLCSDGVKRAQLQGIYPLDEAGDLVLVGRSGCVAGSEDFQVFDLSSGTPVIVDSINTLEPGFNLGMHSPAGSPIGFAVEGKKLVVFEPHQGFSTVSIPCAAICTANGVWANSPTDLWVVTSGAPSQILRYHRGAWVIEYEGFFVRDVWGFAGNPPDIYAAGDGIVRRLPNGTWQEVMSPLAKPAACGGGFWSVHGSSPTDMWVAGAAACVVHGGGPHWFETPGPANAFQGAIAAVWSLDPHHVLLAGQGGVDLTLGLIALWGTADGGASWMQVSDPLFTSLPTATDAGFFNLAASLDGTRIYVPSIAGTLILGTLNWPNLSGRVAAPGAGSSAGVIISPEN